ncbi:hypothetical protein TCAL_07943 [Tigriopus californicus]|uniref:Uncharacterized protein n=1 Tax=Tigriopus californicus TaxID=6832 RepID=A0A553NFZ9_TIGCA|nr:uncharacterized protein LOC131889331 [Tigriopus californicus]TRY64376.1 hypothetical protein TCAL_07943 [Tigriopus californicus]|eukprot:TCALIF_07943-PA protein Name:"Protein of unknown function" AED:0.00 eAED:0.00 QI:50/1/1/1/0.5/0.66/3/92/216
MYRTTLGARRRDKILNNWDRHLNTARSSLFHLNGQLNECLSHQRYLANEKQLRANSALQENSYDYWNPKMNRSIRMAASPSRLLQVYTIPRGNINWDIDFRHRIKMTDQGVFYVSKPGSSLPIQTRDEYGFKILTNLETLQSESEREQAHEELKSRWQSRRRRSDENLFQQNWPLLDRRSTLSMFDMITKPKLDGTTSHKGTAPQKHKATIPAQQA